MVVKEAGDFALSWTRTASFTIKQSIYMLKLQIDGSRRLQVSHLQSNHTSDDADVFEHVFQTIFALILTSSLYLALSLMFRYMESTISGTGLISICLGALGTSEASILCSISL